MILHGLPIGYALTGAKADERQVLLDLLAGDPTLAASRPGQILPADKNHFGREFEASIAGAGIQLLGRARKGEPERPGGRFFKPLPQTVQSIFDTLKGQLDLEYHGGHTPAADGTCAWPIQPGAVARRRPRSAGEGRPAVAIDRPKVRVHRGDMRFAVASYCVVVAVLMALWWGLDIRKGALTRGGDRSRVEIGLHLTAEFATAMFLVIGGIALARGGTRSLSLVGLGMLLYTIIQSPGYFLARHELPPVLMFGVLAALTVAAIAATVAL